MAEAARTLPAVPANASKAACPPNRPMLWRMPGTEPMDAPFYLFLMKKVISVLQTV